MKLATQMPFQLVEINAMQIPSHTLWRMKEKTWLEFIENFIVQSGKLHVLIGAICDLRSYVR